MNDCLCLLCTGQPLRIVGLSTAQNAAVLSNIIRSFRMPSVPVTTYIGTKKKPKAKPAPKAKGKPKKK